MTHITIKGHTFTPVTARDSFGRRALQYKNNIITVLGKLGLTDDDILIDIDPVAIKNVPASATWYLEGYRMYYSYKSAKRYVDNLYIVFKVIEFEVVDLLSKKKTFEEFLSDFTEKDDVEHMRKAARETLGLAPDVIDMAVIDKRYKELAKKCHPDMPGGDTEMFKKINNAHKILKRELE
ncbi:J domain-containing protein [Candidatus Woesearchaeota archaeon]|nr:J domain-containing protein [Candidatus Woesearchaeota archaeon]